MDLDYTKRAGAAYGSTETTQREPGLYTGLDYTKRARAAYGSKLHKESQGCMWVYWDYTKRTGAVYGSGLYKESQNSHLNFHTAPVLWTLRSQKP